MKKILIAGLFAVTMLLSVGCTSFAQSTKDFSEAYTPIMTAQMVRNNVLLKHLKTILENYKASVLAEDPNVIIYIQMENPLWSPENPDPSVPQYNEILLDDYIKEIDNAMEGNLSLAESQELLNASLKEDRGLEPLIEGVKKILTDEELMELIKKYGPLIMPKKIGE